jgi:ribokinase
MTSFLVSGLINIETTLGVDGFPIPYYPVRYSFHQVHATVSGVGYNIARALTRLGDDVRLLAFIGQDAAADWVRKTLSVDGISDDFVLGIPEETARSVILYDGSGRRQIHVDLKEVQGLLYPMDVFDEAVSDCSFVSLCNINYSRPMLKKAQQAGKTIATDVHTIAALHDDYNQDFMRAADILFMSDEALPESPESWARKIVATYGTEIVVIGLGKAGVLMSVKRDHFVERIPSVKIRPVVNTIGAGDALFSAFLHSYAHTGDPYEAIRKAVLFACYKIGEKGAAEGFLSAEDLERVFKEYES